MTGEEALHEVQKALADHSLPGGVGLRRADRTFIVVLSPEDRPAVPAVSGLLTAMGMEVTSTVNGYGTVYGHLAGGLLPAPPVPVSSADSATSAELATVTIAKRCFGPCGRTLPLEDFPFRDRDSGKRFSYCRPCNNDRVKQRRHAKAGSAA